MNNHHYGIILAGGVGFRFWPLSRAKMPKQFLSFEDSGKSFIRLAYERFSDLLPKENIYVVSLNRYKDLVKTHIPEISDDNILLEPYGRNTAPSIAFATYALLKKDPEAIMIVSPSDHIIGDMPLFNDTLRRALDYAAANRALITLGIVPESPDSNFGYIQALGGKRAYEQNCPVKVKTFTEKPSKELAEVFIRSGEFLWNSGIFVWKAQTIREELEKYVPEITKLFSGWENSIGTEQQAEFLERAYGDMEKISIDYAVMEKTEIAWVYPAEFSWADIGNWETLYQYIAEKDSEGNCVEAEETIVKDTRRSIVYSDNRNKLIAVDGLDNYIIIDTDDVLMICPRDDRRLKEITARIGLPDYEKFR